MIYPHHDEISKDYPSLSTQVVHPAYRSYRLNGQMKFSDRGDACGLLPMML